MTRTPLCFVSRDTATPLLPGLTRNGKLVVLGGTMDPIPVSPLQLIGKRRTIQGWPSGTGRDSQVRAVKGRSEVGRNVP